MTARWSGVIGGVSKEAGPEGHAVSGAGANDRTAPKKWRPVSLGIALYGILAAAAYFPVWPGDGSRVPWCACDDTAQAIWFLRWTPFALAHGQNVLVSNWIDFPHGVNLAQNTSMPLLGILAAPLTLLAGPVASFTFLLWLGLTASATACFLVLRHWVRWDLAAFVGGLLYAFSSYMAGQALGHLNLIFVPLPPILILVLHELLVQQRRSARRWGLALGLLAAAQFLISPEILIDSVLLGLLGVILLAAARPAEVAGRVAHAWRGMAWAAAVALPIVAYPIAVYLWGPERYAGSPWHGVTFSEDLLSSIVPGLNQRLTTTGLDALSTRLQSNLAENGAYLGIPLLLLLVFLVVRYRHVGVIRFTAAMAVVSSLLSMGPRLVVDGHQTPIRLPFAVLLHLPVFDSLVAGRFTLFLDLFCAFVVATGIDRLRADMVRRGRVPVRIVVPGLALLLLVALIPLLPRWPYSSVTVDTTTPNFFQSDDVAQIPAGSVVLAYPYPAYPFNQAMLWQAESSMRFRLLGGYALVPGLGGLAMSGPAPVQPNSVATTLLYDFNGKSSSAPDATAADVRALLHRYGIGTVMVDTGGFYNGGIHPAAAITLFTQVLGPPRVVGGVRIWSRIHCTRAATTCAQ
jgi:hypothetical protein